MTRYFRLAAAAVGVTRWGGGALDIPTNSILYKIEFQILGID
jgi:hypothetical protein